ncbi:MAG: hypothetical protein ACK56I_35975, partial [bacterium]
MERIALDGKRDGLAHVVIGLPRGNGPPVNEPDEKLLGGRPRDPGSVTDCGKANLAPRSVLGQHGHVVLVNEDSDVGVYEVHLGIPAGRYDAPHAPHHVLVAHEPHVVRPIASDGCHAAVADPV